MAKDYRFLQKKYVVSTYVDRGLTITKGKGMYLYDDNNRKYLDLMSNVGVNIFGYNHPKINSAIVDQTNTLTSLHGSFANDMRSNASKKLVEKCGGKLKKVYWSNSGAESVEAALKFAVLATGKKRFVVAKNSFHGKTLGSLSATGMPKYKKGLTPLVWDFVSVDYDNLDQLKKAVNKNTAAVILEPIQGDGGIIVPDKDYLRQVESICRKSGCLLILDEVQTGVGRTGWFLASHEQNVKADIVCLGKGLAGGLPVGATLVTENITNKIPKSSHTSTFGGNPLVCVSVIAVLDMLDENVFENIQKNGDYFIKSLKLINSKNILGIRGKGLMIGIEVKDKRDYILRNLQDKGILAIPAADNVVRLLPPYIIEKKQIDLCASILKKIMLS